MVTHVRGAILVLMFVVLGAFSGCGGGGSAGSAGSAGSGGGITALPSRTLNWEAPSSYVDGTPMNPISELDRFEVYVKESGTFHDTDTPQAILSAVDPGTHQLTRSFNLANIPGLAIGPRYWVSLRAVAITDMKSGFAPSASFSF